MLIMGDNYVNWTVKEPERKIELNVKDVGEVGEMMGEGEVE